MPSNVHDAVRTLLANRPQYAKEAVLNVATQDGLVASDGTDSLYVEKTRALRQLEQKIDEGTVGADDLELVAEAVIRYETDNEVGRTPKQTIPQH